MIIDKSIEKTNMKEKLKQFLIQLNLVVEKVLKTIMSKNTLRRWINQLAEIGINSFIFSPEFMIPINFIIRVLTCSDKVVHLKDEQTIKAISYFSYIKGRGS